MLPFILTPTARIPEGSGAFETLSTIYSNLRGTLPVLFLGSSPKKLRVHAKRKRGAWAKSSFFRRIGEQGGGSHSPSAQPRVSSLPVFFHHRIALCHCERSEAISDRGVMGLLRFARNDIGRAQSETDIALNTPTLWEMNLFLDVPGPPVEFALRWGAGRGIIPVVWCVARTPDRTVPKSGVCPAVLSTGNEPVSAKPRMQHKE